ncbi:hypothetical protein [Cellulomonas sp. URHB0016]
MSTSDPHATADGTTGAGGSAPGSQQPATPPPTTAPQAEAAAVRTGTPTETSTDTGRHAVVRPNPLPPAPAPAPADAAAAERRPAVRPATHGPAAPSTGTPPPATDAMTSGPATPDAAVPDTPDTPEASGPPTAPEDPRLFPDPNAPRSTSLGAHVLGVVVGLVLAPIGIATTLLGQSRILAAQVDGWDGSTEVLGIVLVTAGLLLLAVVVLLGLWTPSVPLTGGAALALVGSVYLYAPALAREQTLNVLSSSGWRLTVTQVTVAGTSGTLVVAGVLLLVAGLVTALARRFGVRLGAFRERHRV